MSKRFFPQQHGERKKAKLDITISDHNFPLSQNAAANDDNWGDDNDDEILLMASQACEQAYENNSTLPDFSLCMQPGATSTQMFAQPGPSKDFKFKKPTVNSPHLTSTHLKDKCNRISSPLPGMSLKISNGDTIKYNDDLIYNDKVYKGQDPDHVYRQLLQLQEENAKLKSENGKLLDKCVTKEGEASILRTQLKSCQVAVDNARMEKIKAQEKVQMEWTDKLSAVNGQMHDLRTQLDFKNLEIISIKERCRMLESTKVKLTQVTVPNNDISSSHRQNSTCYGHNSSLTQRRVKVSSIGTQIDNKTKFLKLYKSHETATRNLTSILSAILEPTAEQPSILEYNEKLQQPRACGVLSTLHQSPAPAGAADRLSVADIYEDLTCIAEGVDVPERFDKIVHATLSALRQVCTQLSQVRRRATAAFRRDMEQRYIDASAAYARVTKRALLTGRALYKDEQGILARRLVAVLARLLHPSRRLLPPGTLGTRADEILHALSEVCSLIDVTSCGTVYSGLLYAIVSLLEALPASDATRDVAGTAARCRSSPHVASAVLSRVATCRARGATVRVDYDQGVLLFRNDSCPLLVAAKQVEAGLTTGGALLRDTSRLLALTAATCGTQTPDCRCDCQLVLMQVLVYALRTCAVMLNKCPDDDSVLKTSLLAVCRAGALSLHRRVSRDVELCSRLAHAEGCGLEFVETLRVYPHPDLYENMLAEVSAAFQCAAEDAAPSFHRAAWRHSFATFTAHD